MKPVDYDQNHSFLLQFHQHSHQQKLDRYKYQHDASSDVHKIISGRVVVNLFKITLKFTDAKLTTYLLPVLFAKTFLVQ